jgi:hypothetical protein
VTPWRGHVQSPSRRTGFRAFHLEDQGERGREGEKRRKNLYSWIHSIDFFSSLIPVKQEIRL